MNRRLLPLLVTLPLLLACAPQSSSQPEASPSSAPTPSSAPASSSEPVSSSEASSAESGQSTAKESSKPAGETYLFYELKEGADKSDLGGAPWVNSVREGVAARIVKPSEKDDFYLNKTYEMQVNAKLGEGDIAIGGMPGAIKTVSERTTKMLTEKTSSAYSDALRSVYDLFKKEDKSAEVAYVKGLIDEIKAISSLDAMADYFYTKGYDSVWPLFELVHAGRGKIILKEENMGLTPSSINFAYLYGGAEEKQRVIDTSVYLLGLYGYSESEAKALLDSAAGEYSAAVSGGSAPSEFTVGGLDEEYPHLRLKDYFSTKLGYALTDKVAVDSNIARLLKAMSAAHSGQTGEVQLSLKAMKDILILRAAFISAISRGMQGENGYIALTQGLNSNTQGFNDDMFEKDIFGTYFRDAYDRLYIDNYETKERRASIVSLMGEIVGEYKVLLNESTWLDESTRKAAIDKLESMKFDACYPVCLESLPTWNFSTASSFMEAVNAYSAWSRLASQPANENFYLWGATITTINGIYSPMSNSFVIFDGLLASESYGADMAKEDLYGSIGAVIGHEISHAFDVNGARYDKTGATVDWWTEKDKAAYQTKVDRIKAVWSQYENKPGMKLSCEDDMLGEIIADMGGVSVCLRLGAKQNGFDYGKFFTAYANMHGSIMSDMFIESFIYGGASGKQDSHPLSVFRVNGVVNQFAKFYETFGVSEGDKMFVPENERLNIWG